MNKKYRIQLITLIVVLISLNGCKKDKNIRGEEHSSQEPVKITKLIPAQNIIGSDFMIVGSGFDPIASNNVVKIGNVTLTVKEATATSLVVNTPENWIIDNVSVSTGVMNATTPYKYRVNDNSYKLLRLKSSLEGATDLFEFKYNANNQLIKREASFLNPINHLTFFVGETIYSYDATGLLIKEVYTPSDSNLQIIKEYLYTDGHLTSDKVYNLNMDNSTVTNLSSHSYVILGRQLVRKVTKGANGDQVSSESFDYDIINDIPQVIKTTDSVGGGIFTATYIQHPLLFDPLALLLPGAPRSTLFLASSATFTDPSIQNYTISAIFPAILVLPSVSYQYAGGFAYVDNFEYENKQ